MLSSDVSEDSYGVFLCINILECYVVVFICFLYAYILAVSYHAKLQLTDWFYQQDIEEVDFWY